MAVFVPDFAYKGGTITDFLNPLAPILDGAWDVEAFVADGAIYAYVSASSDHGIQLIDFSRINKLPITPFVFAITDAEVGGLHSPRDIELLNIGTSTFLITASYKLQSNEAPGTISVFLMDETPGDSFGDLTLTDSVTSDTALFGITDFTMARVGFKTFIVGVSTHSDTLSVVSVNSDGTLGRMKSVSEAGNSALPLDGIFDVGSAYVDNDRLIVTAANGAEGLGLWRMSGNGTLTLIDTANPSADQGAGSFLSRGLHVAQISKSVAMAFAYDVTTKSVLSYQLFSETSLFNPEELQYRGAVFLGNTYLNDAMVEMKTIAYMGETFLVTSDANNNAVSLFHMNGSTGALALLQTVANGEPGLLLSQGTAYIQNSQGLDIVELNGRLVVVQASTTGGLSGGVTLLEIGGGLPGSFEGGADDDLFFNFSRDALARGNGGDDLFRAGLGSLSAYGGTGNDDWRGGVKDEFAYGGTGNDILSGGSGDDTIYGGHEAGEVTNDTEGDADIIGGGKGKDVIKGYNDDDSLYGEDNADTLYGESGNDLIYGGKGNDLIFGGLDDDTLDGGTGSDDFVFLTIFGPNNDVINNFEVSVDQIKFKGSEVNNIFDVLAIMSQDGADVVITVSANCTLTLTDITLDDLTPANFLYD